MMPVTLPVIFVPGDIVETCYMRGELLLNPTGVGNSAMLAVLVALECIQSNAAT
jgi:hypothetical protein